MEVRLLLPLYLLHVVTLFYIADGVIAMEEILGDAQPVTPRPTTLQNITTPQCDNCPPTSTQHQPIHRSTVLCTNHTAQGPSPASSPIEYVVVGMLGVCLRIKAIFIIVLNSTKMTNITIPSPPITEARGNCFGEQTRLSLYFSGGQLILDFMKNKNENVYFLWYIYADIQGEDGPFIWGYTYLEAMVTPLGHTFSCDVVTLDITANVSVVLMDLKVQAFSQEGDNFGSDNESTFIIYDSHAGKFLSFKEWKFTKFIPSIHTIVLLVALPLNVMAIVTFLVKMKVKKPTIVFMLNLAMADVLFVSVLPFLIVYRFSGSDWRMGDGMCRFVMAAFYCNMYCSILLMTSISVDRFLAVVYPVRSLYWRTISRAWLVCGVIWTMSLASTVPLLLGEQTILIPGLGITTCYDVQYSIDVYFYFSYFTSLLSLFFFLPLTITTFCYAKTIHSLSTIKMKSSSKRSRAIYLTLIVLSVFILCFGPTNLIHFSYYLQVYKYGDDSLYNAYILSSSICSISCCLDPLIYYFASSECQRYVYSLLHCKKGHRPPGRQLYVLTGQEGRPEVTDFLEVAC